MGKITFGDLEIWEGNKSALVACESVLMFPGKINPLYVYGPNGSGKTSLLEALSNQVSTLNPKAKILVFTWNKLVQNVSDFSPQVNFEKLIRILSDMDFVLIDDFFEISPDDLVTGKITQLFSSFISAEKQMVICGETAPNDMKKLDSALRSILERGKSVEMQLYFENKEMASETTKIASKISALVTEDINLSDVISSREYKSPESASQEEEILEEEWGFDKNQIECQF